MAEKMVVKIMRVEEEDVSTEPVLLGGFVKAVVPFDGYIFKPEWAGAMPVYVRDEDLEAAKKLREEKRRPVSITAKSWG